MRWWRRRRPVCPNELPIRSKIRRKLQRHVSQVDGGPVKKKKTNNFHYFQPSKSLCLLHKNVKNVERKRSTNARMQAVTPVPQEVTTGLSKEMPARMDRL